jgi:RimJ/RimL family protein N-acetyltransferase
MPSTFSRETDRLRLRAAAEGDVEDLVRLHDDPLVAEYLGPRDRDWYEWRVAASIEEWSERGYGFVVVEDAAGRFLGRTGLKYWPEFGETELGWVLRPEARGRGYATEAGQALLDWGFEGFDFPYVTAMIRPGNAASVAVAERLGMAPRREDELQGDAVVVYSIGRRAWEGRSE